MGLAQLLFTVIIMVINQRFFDHPDHGIRCGFQYAQKEVPVLKALTHVLIVTAAALKRLAPQDMRCRAAIFRQKRYQMTAGRRSGSGPALTWSSSLPGFRPFRRNIRKPQPSTDSCAAMRSRVQRKTVPVCRHRPAPAQTAPLYSLCLHFSQTIRPRFPYIIPLPEPDFSSRTPVLLISGWTLHRSIRRLRR